MMQLKSEFKKNIIKNKIPECELTILPLVADNLGWKQWQDIISQYALPDNFIDDYIKHFNCYDLWDDYLRGHLITEEWLDKYKDNYLGFVWSSVFYFYDVDKDYIDKFNKYFYQYDRRGWYDLCRYQKLSIEIINAYKNKFNSLCWNEICEYQKFDINFIDKFYNYINNTYCWKTIYKFQNISREDINKLIKNKNKQRRKNSFMNFINKFKRW